MKKPTSNFYLAESVLKAATLFFASLAFCAAAAAADIPRLALWITAPIGTSNGVQCHLPEASANTQNLPEIQPTLTDHDITEWNPDNARWILNPALFTLQDIVQKLQDHCFVLAIDGKVISSGVVLSSHSARLTGFPTLSVYSQNNALYLQLTSGNHGSHSRLIHVDALNAVLGQRANLEHQLRRVAAVTSDAQHTQGELLQIGKEWTTAVQQLIDQKKIRQGAPIVEVIKHLGPPTYVATSEGSNRYASYHWYFNTPRHVNPVFTVQTEDEIVRSYSFGRR